MFLFQILTIFPIQKNNTLIFTSYLLPIFVLIIQLIIWLSFSSFSQSSKCLNFPRIRKYGHIYALILVIGLGLGIIYTGIYSYFDVNMVNLTISERMLIGIVMDILAFPSAILLIIGYFMLSINLIKEDMAKLSDNNVQHFANQSNSTADQINFCKYCGYPIESFTNFCPDCGKPLIF